MGFLLKVYLLHRALVILSCLNNLPLYSLWLNCNNDSVFCHTGDKSEEELLKGLLTDDYCHVCEAVLLFESQRLSHYEVCVCYFPGSSYGTGAQFY